MYISTWTEEKLGPDQGEVHIRSRKESDVAANEHKHKHKHKHNHKHEHEHEHKPDTALRPQPTILAQKVTGRNQMMAKLAWPCEARARAGRFFV